jgi:hypothetical protein
VNDAIILRCGHFEGEDFAEDSGRRVAVKPQFVVQRSSNLLWV